jgi:hypothetical protein
MFSKMTWRAQRSFPFLFTEDDVSTIFENLGKSCPALIPSAVHLPKVDAPQNIIDFAELFDQASLFGKTANFSNYLYF